MTPGLARSVTPSDWTASQLERRTARPRSGSRRLPRPHGIGLPVARHRMP